ncbi:MAG: ATP-binding protein [Anaerolineales bacterium]|nr:ATP-binding protein [Anaerolineales bacterium]
MSLKPINLENLKHRELETIYEISRVILQSVDTASALKEIIRLARPVFIFDNVVLYQFREAQCLTPTYARSVGRGRSNEADLSWGEAFANEVLEKKDIINHRENFAKDQDDRGTARLKTRFYLGLPLNIGGEAQGALVFIRFGGPVYLPEQINLAQLIAEHIEHLLERQNLVNQIANLEADRKLDRLQQEFVATISHDLRSPLGFIKGYTTTLLRDDITWDNESRQEFLTIINEEADRLSNLIDNLLDSSRLQSGTLQMSFRPERLDTLLTELAQRAQMGEHNFKVRLDLEKSETKIWIDTTRLIQVFDNLISNAAKYAPGSSIDIALRWRPEIAHITIRDHGPGIPSDHLENIFKRFYRLPEYQNTAKGSGLGLFICRQIINAHEGVIYAESILGKGTGFHILLPRHWTPEEHETSKEV